VRDAERGKVNLVGHIDLWVILIRSGLLDRMEQRSNCGLPSRFPRILACDGWSLAAEVRRGVFSGRTCFQAQAFSGVTERTK